MNSDAPARWFRMYAEFLTDPKVQMLSEQDQRRFIMLLCIRCSNGDVTFDETEIAFQLRITLDEWEATKMVLLSKNLIGSDNKPVAWNKRQFVSDSSTARVARHREKAKQECNVTVTPPETETETELKEPIGSLSSLELDGENAVDPPSEKKEKVPVKEIIDFLNEKAGTSFKQANKATTSHIRARWNEGFRVDDFKAVIEHKCAEWRTDAKMVQFLRPQTLFSRNFEAYLQAAKAQPVTERGQPAFDYSGLRVGASVLFKGEIRVIEEGFYIKYGQGNIPEGELKDLYRRGLVTLAQG